MKELIVGEHTFEIVDSIPVGYQFWNIGRNMPDGWLPLCRLSAIQPFPGGRNIEVDTLKAIRLEGAQTVLNAASRCGGTIQELERFVYKHSNAVAGSSKHRDMMLAKEALKILEVLR